MAKGNDGGEDSVIPGLAVLGLLVAGIAGLVLSALAASKGDFMAAGICLVPVVLSFAALAHMSFR